ncbi:DNA-directed RNA polymerase subunit beta [Companilactobacillus jidongensis]|uniref:DNA-directed RNA polymerase subunit beta n=1 Tax=Companilactobacillus jidongensis TaxID=2486006 RepID=UPI000F766DB5|nr:DNA-directed RNA polymerase subunit beta [Companilactobacillus jidongensis]
MERIVPRDKWLYDDRGMVKWMGWLLSDHSAFLDHIHTSERPRQIETEMDNMAINECLRSSLDYAESIAIQLDILKNNDYVPEIHGIVAGFENNQVYLYLKDGSIQSIFTEDIRYAELEKNVKWWDE